MLDIQKSILIDNHAHSLNKGFLECDAIEFRKCFSESRSLSYLENHAQHTIGYLNLLEELRQIFQFDSEADYLELRQSFSQEEHVHTLWDDASIGGLLVDDGYMVESILSVNELAGLSGRQTYRVLRLEWLIEQILVDSTSLKDVEDRLEQEISSAKERQIVAVKTIAAYRGGLPSSVEVERESAKFTDLVLFKGDHKNPFRIADTPAYYFLLLRAFELAGAYDLPIQIHAGLGDSDEILHNANPTLMTPILKDSRFSKCKFVFLHCYPYHKEASYLCSVFSNCYMDLSLSVVLASVVMKQLFLETLALAPASKLFAGTDGHSIPEMHWYGAMNTKKALQSALDQLVAERFLRSTDALSIAEKVLYRNCRDFYQLTGLL